MKLDFLIAGINKCGSTTLTSLIEKHPDVFISPSKDGHYPQGAGLCKKNGLYPGWEAHKKSFWGSTANQLKGEGNIWYTSPKLQHMAAQFLLDTFPDIKLIFIVRDPIKRIESSFKEKHSSGARWMTNCPYTLEEALAKYPDLIESSKYFERISFYLNLFPNENIHIVFLEELHREFSKTLNSCFTFLNLDPAPDIQPEKQNASSEKYYDTPELRVMRDSIHHPETGLPLEKLSLDLQDQFLVPLGYRKPINELDTSWSQSAITTTINALESDIDKFLRLTNKDKTIWKKYAELASST